MSVQGQRDMVMPRVRPDAFYLFRVWPHYILRPLFAGFCNKHLRYCSNQYLESALLRAAGATKMILVPAVLQCCRRETYRKIGHLNDRFPPNHCHFHQNSKYVFHLRERKRNNLPVLVKGGRISELEKQHLPAYQEECTNMWMHQFSIQVLYTKSFSKFHLQLISPIYSI